MELPQEAAAYAKADFHDVNKAFVERLLQLAKTDQQAQAVDLGTGPAEIPILVAQARPAWRITAVDAGPIMLEHAKAAVKAAGGLGGRVELRQCDATDTQLPVASFDVVFSNSLLHHVSDPLKLWQEVARIAKPGAVVLLRDLARPRTTTYAREIVHRYATTASRLLKDEYYRSLLAAYTAGEVRQQLQQANLTQLKVEMVTDRHLDVLGRL